MTSAKKPDDSSSEELDLRLRFAEVSARLGENIDPQLREIADVAGFDLSGNANSFVPWSDPQIPYECSCGQIIYADSVHTHDEFE